jgi:serine/threonine protein kinase
MKSTRRVRRRKQTRRKRRGGKKLGEGKHGFVVDPAIPCKDKDTTGYVSKVFKDKQKFEAVKNNPVFAKLKEIDPNQDSFLYPETCSTFGELSEENKTDGVTDDMKQQSYLMKRGGMSLLDEFKEKSKEFIPMLTVASAQKKNPEREKAIDDIVRKALEYLTPIITDVREHLKKLHDGGILHRDFHAGNVLRMNDGTFRIIDFDASRLISPEDSKTNEESQFIEDGATLIFDGGTVSKNLVLRGLQINVAQKVLDSLFG